MKNLFNNLTTVWYQYFLSFKTYWPSFIIYHGLTPIIYMLAFGLFAAPMYEHTLNIDTKFFIFTGFFCYALTIGALSNVSYALYFDLEPAGKLMAMRPTPISFNESILGRIIWSCSRTFLTGILTLIAGYIVLGISAPLHILIINIALLFIINLCMASIALLFVAYVIYTRESCDSSKIIEVSMIACSGIFIPIHLFPSWLESLAHIFPLYHSVTITRALWSGESILPHIPSLSILCLCSIFCFFLATHKLKQRLFT